MSYKKLAKIVERLIQQTEKGELKWEDTAESDIFIVAFPGYTISISSRFDNFNENVDYLLTISNQEGKIIEQVSDEALREVLPKSYEQMRNLYDAARRKAMGVDEALDKILSQLPSSDSDDDIPF